MSKFEVGTRVEYIGKAWPERVGWKGTVTSTSTDRTMIIFDNLRNSQMETICYHSSLREIEE